jgi:hypothetical protein
MDKPIRRKIRWVRQMLIAGADFSIGAGQKKRIKKLPIKGSLLGADDDGFRENPTKLDYSS